MDEFDQEGITDQALIQAVRKRLLEELAAKRGDSEKIVNNVYGGGASGGGGVMDRMGSGGDEMSPEDQEYFVDILRQNYEPGEEAMVMDPQTGKPMPQKLGSGGWQKKVHRFTRPKKKMTMEGQE